MMEDKMRLAMAAARAGQKKEAQFLLTEVLKDNPRETNAWFLLSHLVDSEEKQITYLEKVIALDPGHQKATDRLAELTGTISEPEITEPETVMMTEPEPVIEPEPSVEPAIIETLPDAPEEAMDWLEELVAEDSPVTEEVEKITAVPPPEFEPDIQPEPEETAVTTAKLAPPPAQPEPDAADNAQQLQRLNIALVVLAVLFVIALYFLFNNLAALF